MILPLCAGCMLAQSFFVDRFGEWHGEPPAIVYRVKQDERPFLERLALSIEPQKIGAKWWIVGGASF